MPTGAGDNSAALTPSRRRRPLDERSPADANASQRPGVESFSPKHAPPPATAGGTQQLSAAALLVQLEMEGALDDFRVPRLVDGCKKARCPACDHFGTL
jgi:hypothetical protein